jgi:hypothetical protein
MAIDWWLGFLLYGCLFGWRRAWRVFSCTRVSFGGRSAKGVVSLPLGGERKVYHRSWGEKGMRERLVLGLQ